MGKNAIFTIAIHDCEYFQYTILTMRYYAEKINCDLVVLEEPFVGFRNIYFEKMYFLELLKVYDRVLYLDADIVITPNAKDIFKRFPDKEVFYAFNENLDDDVMDRDSFVKAVVKDGDWWPVNGNGKYQYFNAGVFLISKSHAKFFENFKADSKVEGVLDWDTDQTMMNYIVAFNKIPFKSLPYSFNRMFLGKKDEWYFRYEASFIHYAGNGYCHKKQRAIFMLSDYCHLYNYSLSIKEKTIFAIHYANQRFMRIIKKFRLF